MKPFSTAFKRFWLGVADLAVRLVSRTRKPLPASALALGLVLTSGNLAHAQYGMMGAYGMGGMMGMVGGYGMGGLGMMGMAGGYGMGGYGMSAATA
jgi:hypothetical protein